jgi:hypothetical protein
VVESYELIWDRGPPTCSDGYDQAFGTSVSFVVAGKGEIHFALEATGCIPQQDFNAKNTQAYTITGGTGIYAGASGTGKVERTFDLTRPTLTGATNKTVKARKGAKSARVVFRVTAQDDRDGAVPVSCSPARGAPSGSAERG